MPARPYRFVGFFFAASLLGAALLGYCAQAFADQPVSIAEDRLFLANHLGNLPPDAVLRYAYSKTGTLEAGRSDKVKLTLSSGAAGSGREVHVDYLTGDQRFELPVMHEANGNPVILFFLERDVREMQRLTGGQSAYFRKRVRMALAEAAEVRPITFEFAGHEVTGQEITVHPYQDDPLRKRFERLAGKSYTFTLSDHVPGMLYRMQTLVPGPASGDGTPPLIEETISLVGTEP
jgi:hypothetical protein